MRDLIERLKELEAVDLRVGPIPAHMFDTIAKARKALEAKGRDNAAVRDLAAFAESVLIYLVEGDEEHVWLRYGRRDICICKADSAEGVVLLKMEADRRAALEAKEAEIAAATAKLAHLKKCSDALLKVRPLGGSELFVRVGEENYADPEYCGAAIERMHADLHEAKIATVMARREIAAARLQGILEGREEAAKVADHECYLHMQTYAKSTDEQQRERLAARARTAANIGGDIRALPSPGDGGFTDTDKQTAMPCAASGVAK